MLISDESITEVRKIRWEIIQIQLNWGTANWPPNTPYKFDKISD